MEGGRGRGVGTGHQSQTASQFCSDKEERLGIFQSPSEMATISALTSPKQVAFYTLMIFLCETNNHLT